MCVRCGNNRGYHMDGLGYLLMVYVILTHYQKVIRFVSTTFSLIFQKLCRLSKVYTGLIIRDSFKKFNNKGLMISEKSFCQSRKKGNNK